MQQCPFPKELNVNKNLIDLEGSYVHHCTFRAALAVCVDAAIAAASAISQSDVLSPTLAAV